MEETPPQKQERPVERFFEAFIFSARWILAPAYVLLGACMVVLLFKLGEEFVELVSDWKRFAQTRAIAQILLMVDLVLVMNLVLMILFVGYNNFVSKMYRKEWKEDWPQWMGDLDYAGLKLQLLGSIIAVSAVNLLRLTVEMADGGPIETQRMMWLGVFHCLFLASALSIGVVNWLKASSKSSLP